MRAAACILILIFIACGTLALIAAITDAKWLFGSANARMLTATIKRRTARILYGLAGACIIAMALHMALHLPPA